MSRKAFSDGLKKALLDAGAVDLMQGTVLAHHEAMEPGGGGVACPNCMQLVHHMQHANMEIVASMLCLQ